MTDRFKGCLVTFEMNIREDDAVPILSAIRQMRGVLDVSPVPVNIEDHINRSRVRDEIREVLWKALGDA